jgi:hypothetical protein
MLEMALVLPVLAILLMGSLSVSRAAYDAMIVQELADEAGKMGALDRLSPDGNDSYQMSTEELVQWIKEGAHYLDSSIAQDSIAADPNFHFTGKNVFEDPHSGAYGDMQCFLSAGPLATILNPGLNTVHLKYNYATGFATATIPIRYDFHYTAYQMSWIPFTDPSSAKGCS